MTKLHLALIAVIAVIVVAIAGLGVHLYLVVLQDPENINGGEEIIFVPQEEYEHEELNAEFLASIDVSEQLGGEILITTIERVPGKEEPIGDDGLPIPMQGYSYSVAANSINPISIDYPVWFLDQRDQEPHELLLVAQPSFTDPTYDFTVYNPALYLVDPTGPVRLSYENSGHESGVHRRLPRWSHSGDHYLYTAMTWNEDETRPPIEEVDSWGVYISEAELEATPVHFAQGYGAVWSANDEYIVYVKNDGVYAKAFHTEPNTESEEVVLVEGQYRYELYNQLGISEDGQYLAVVYPVGHRFGDSYVDIYKLDFDPAVSAELVRRVPMREGVVALWPLFSPGGRYLALQTSRIVNENENDYQIRIYDLVEKEFIRNMDINNFYFEYAFNTDWVTALTSTETAP